MKMMKNSYFTVETLLLAILTIWCIAIIIGNFKSKKEIKYSDAVPCVTGKNLTSTSENKLGISNQGFSCKMSSQGFSHEMPKDSLDFTIKDKEINYSPGGKVAQFSSQATLPVETLSICCGTGTIKIYYLDGRVEIPKGVSLPEASRVFWDAVGKAFAEFKKTIISEYEKEKKNE